MVGNVSSWSNLHPKWACFPLVNRVVWTSSIGLVRWGSTSYGILTEIRTASISGLFLPNSSSIKAESGNREDDQSARHVSYQYVDWVLAEPPNSSTAHHFNPRERTPPRLNAIMSVRIQYRIPFKSFARRLVCTCMGTCLIPWSTTEFRDIGVEEGKLVLRKGNCSGAQAAVHRSARADSHREAWRARVRVTSLRKWGLICTVCCAGPPSDQRRSERVSE